MKTKTAKEFMEEINTNEVYQAVFEELKAMPQKGDEQEEDAGAARWVWFREKLNDMGLYEQLTDALMSGIAPAATDKIKKRLSKTESDGIDGYDGIDVVSMKSKKLCNIDTLVFMEALQDTVNHYTGKSKEGKVIPFTQHLHMKYTRLAEIEKKRNSAQEKTGGVTAKLNDKKLRNVMKLSKTVNDIQQEVGFDSDFTTCFDKAVEVCSNEPNCTFTEEELRYAKYYVRFGESCRLYFEDSEGEEVPLPIAAEADQAFDDIISGSEGNEIFSNFGKKWEKMKAVTKLRDRDMLKIFFSRDILIALKLERIPSKLFNDYEEKSKIDPKYDIKKDIEPKCGSWCSQRKDCKYKKKNRNYRGCYIRIGRIPGETENGDDGVYQILASENGEVYDCVLDNEYVQYAFVKAPENLYDVYTNKLKDFRDPDDKFEFTDAIMEKSLNLQEKSLSRKRERYETVIKPRFWELLKQPV